MIGDQKVYNVSYYHENDNELCWILDIVAQNEEAAKLIAKDLLNSNRISIIDAKRINYDC